MERRYVNRRAFLQSSLTALAGTAAFMGSVGLATSGRASTRKCLPIRLGGPAFASTEDPDQLALAHRKLGYSAA